MAQFWWYVARSGGIVSWALLTASVLWGLALSTKAFGRRPKPVWLLDLHQWLGMLTMIFIGVHVVGLMADSYTHFGISEVLVPFAATWHPVAVAWGVIAFYLLLAVELTALARRWMPKQVWRSVHYLSFPVFILATVHGVTAGTDTGSTVAVAAVVVVVAMVAMLSFIRLDQASQNVDAPPRIAARAPRPGAGAVHRPTPQPAPPAYRPGSPPRSQRAPTPNPSAPVEWPPAPPVSPYDR